MNLVAKKAEVKEAYKVEKKLVKLTARAVHDFNMIESGDKVMVCLSGGKDSYTMLDLLMHFQKVSPIKFDIVAVNLDQKQPGFPEHILPEYLSKLGVDYKILERDTYSIVVDKVPEGKTMCSLCSRLRRGTIYGYAEEIGATKIALGHHRDDSMETLFLNMFFNGRLEAMPGIYRTDDDKHTVIRPLIYCEEEDIEFFSNEREFPIIPCNLCGSQENLQRKKIKAMLQEWNKDFPGRLDSIFGAMKNVSLTHMLDPKLAELAKREE